MGMDFLIDPDIFHGSEFRTAKPTGFGPVAIRSARTSTLREEKREVTNTFYKAREHHD
jgi:hypothetical protein